MLTNGEVTHPEQQREERTMVILLYTLGFSQFGRERWHVCIYKILYIQIILKRLILQQNKYTPKERKKEFPDLFLETPCSINLLLNSLWIKTLAYLSDMQVTTAILVPWLLEVKNSHLFSIALGSQLLYCYNIKLCDHCPTISSGLQKKATIEQNSASILFTNVFLMALVNGCVLWAFLQNIILW